MTDSLSPTSAVPPPLAPTTSGSHPLKPTGSHQQALVSRSAGIHRPGASSGAPSAGTSGRAPLPTRQPRNPKTVAVASAPADKAAGSGAGAGKSAASLARLSAPSGPKMNMSAAISPSPADGLAAAPKMSMTSKEWVIPPRPKPGRKPATDTPPTKRKAQNRAAQRAFRERRAARVGELEQQLDEQREVYDKNEAELKERIHGLELDVQSFRSRCMLLENMMERERQERLRAETHAESLRRRIGVGSSDTYFRSSMSSMVVRNSASGQSSQRHMSHVESPSYQDLEPTRRLSQRQSQRFIVEERHFSIPNIITPPEPNPQEIGDMTLGCGNCSLGGPCACADEVLASATNGCGNCSFGGQCQCLEEAAKGVGPTHELKRPHSPSMASAGSKRHRSDVSVVMSIENDATHELKRPSSSSMLSGGSKGAAASMETDFTAMFSRRSTADAKTPQQIQNQQAQSQMQNQTHSETRKQSPPPPYSISSNDGLIPLVDSVPLKDRCGFCIEGSYCMCAEEAAMATPAMTPTADTLPPITQQRQQQTPPPSEPDMVVAPPLFMEMTADGAVKLPRRRVRAVHQKPTKTNSGGCGANGPGTCAQCQADPKSGLFCRLMAAKFDREKQASGGGGCCGGKGAGGGCCKSQTGSGSSSNSNSNSSSSNSGMAQNGGAGRITLPSLPSLGLSCAEAYQTLSSHRNFDRAADDIGSWLPKLKATTPGTGVQRGRQSIEVEAASIMSVLKEFDVRFGREC